MIEDIVYMLGIEKPVARELAFRKIRGGLVKIANKLANRYEKRVTLNF